MPYIKEENRKYFSDAIDLGMNASCAGELNYIFSRVIIGYLSGIRDNITMAPVMNYQRINDAIGALECCKLELYRRKVGPYEDEKIKENGDVY